MYLHARNLKLFYPFTNKFEQHAELLQIVIGPLCGHYFCNRKEIPQEHIRDDFSNTLCYFLLLGQTQFGPLQRLLGGLGMCYIYIIMIKRKKENPQSRHFIEVQTVHRPSSGR